MRVKGKVKWFDSRLGYGFVEVVSNMNIVKIYSFIIELLNVVKVNINILLKANTLNSK